MRDQIPDQPRDVDLHELRCGCGEPVADGPGGFTHRDGAALCGTHTSQAVEPVEVNR